ncbi:MAG: DUF4199 domain-containing protein [Prevotella sp.]|nr:DUF4199 domain-containing protein [Prevotella sp.]
MSNFATIMTAYQNFEQVQAFARIDGALMAALWVASFACFIGNFSYPLLGTVGFFIGGASLVYNTLRLKNFRDHVLEGIISFRKAFSYSLLTYLYASLLFAVGQYVYFQFIDNGFLVSRYTAIMSMDEFKQMMSVYGMTASDMQMVIGNLTQLRPIEIVFQFFTMNVLMGVFITPPVALIMKRTRKRFQH